MVTGEMSRWLVQPQVSWVLRSAEFCHVGMCIKITFVKPKHTHLTWLTAGNVPAKPNKRNDGFIVQHLLTRNFLACLPEAIRLNRLPADHSREMSGEEATGDKCSNASALYILVYSRWVGTHTRGQTHTGSVLHFQHIINGMIMVLSVQVFHLV